MKFKWLLIIALILLLNHIQRFGTQEQRLHECALKPIGIVQAQGPYGSKLAKVYPLRIRLPNDIGLKLKAIEADNLGPDGDVLIGMDIITLGDFAVSTYEGRTAFTFRMPSQGRIDFLPPEQRHLSG